MSGLVRATDELGKEPLVLDGCDGAFREKQPQVRFLRAATAITANGSLDLVGFDFKDKGTAMAVASICFQGLGCRHGCLLERVANDLGISPEQFRGLGRPAQQY